jgi:BTB/POZ domain
MWAIIKPSFQIRLTVIKQWLDQKFSLVNNFELLLTDGLFSDLKIKTSDGKILNAHKSILAVRCPAFCEKFRTDMNQIDKAQVDFKEFDSNVVEKLLRFIYCGKIENFEEIASKLIFAAEKFQLVQLKEMCMQCIIQSLSIENVIPSFGIATNISGTKELFMKCVEICKT